MKTVWTCKKCRCEGCIDHDRHTDIWLVVQSIGKSHERRSPNCHKFIWQLEIILDAEEWEKQNEKAMRARLIELAEDHAVIARLLCADGVRWKSASKEVCIGSLTYSTHLDEFGIPVITEGIRRVIDRLGIRSTPTAIEETK